MILLGCIVPAVAGQAAFIIPDWYHFGREGFAGWHDEKGARGERGKFYCGSSLWIIREERAS